MSGRIDGMLVAEKSVDVSLSSSPLHASQGKLARFDVNNRTPTSSQLATEMSSLIYLGVSPPSGQIVSETIRQRGLNLLREAPCNLSVTSSRDVTTVAYERYLANVGAALQSAIEGKTISISFDTVFYAFNKTELPPFYRNPAVYWTYSEKKSADFTDKVKERFNARETICDGKVAYFANLTRDQARNLCLEQLPNQTLKRSSLYLDLASFRVVLKLYALFWAVAKLQQYPLCSTDGTPNEIGANNIFFDMADTLKGTGGRFT